MIFSISNTVSLENKESFLQFMNLVKYYYVLVTVLMSSKNEYTDLYFLMIIQSLHPLLSSSVSLYDTTTYDTYLKSYKIILDYYNVHHDINVNSTSSEDLLWNSIGRPTIFMNKYVSAAVHSIYKDV